MIDLIALIRALMSLIQPLPRGKHRWNKPRTVHLPAPALVELWPAPEPIMMDGADSRAYSLHRGPYVHWEQWRWVQRAERDRRGIDLLVQISHSTPAFDDMAELRDLVRTAIAVGAVRS